MTESILECNKKRFPIRIWVSLEGLIPEEDIVVGNEEIPELVIDITSRELLTISKINERGVISQNLRPLLDYAPMRMKSGRTLFYPDAYNSVNRARYNDYKTRLTKVGVWR